MNGIFDSSWGTYNILLCTILKKTVIPLIKIYVTIHVSAVKSIYDCM